MSNDTTEILKESIDRHRRELIQHYFTMDIDHFEETVRTQISAIVQTVKTAIPSDYVDKLMKKIEQITLNADIKNSHIKTIEVEHQIHIEDIFDDIFDDIFFNFFDGFGIFEIEGISDEINNLFMDNTISNECTNELEVSSYTMPKSVDQYLEQFTSSNDEYINSQNQEIDMN